MDADLHDEFGLRPIGTVIEIAFQPFESEGYRRHTIWSYRISGYSKTGAGNRERLEPLDSRTAVMSGARIDENGNLVYVYSDGAEYMPNPGWVKRPVLKADVVPEVV